MRNLILLEQDYKELEADIFELNEKIEKAETKLGLSSTGFDEILSSSTRKNTSEILLEKYISLKIKYQLKLKKKEQVQNTINFYYELYKQSHNEAEMIYIEKNIRKYSNAKISVLHNGISTATIYRKEEEVYKKYRDLLKKEKTEKIIIQNATINILKELRASK